MVLKHFVLCCACVFLSTPGHSQCDPGAFLPGERVAFVGDSITHAGTYVAYLQMRLMEAYPDNPPRLFNCGVNGDTAGTFLSTDRVSWDVAPLHPDRIFVMLGMNDVNRELWKTPEPTSDENAHRRDETISNYRANLLKLVDALRPTTTNLVLMTPSPYDQYGTFDDKANLGCNDPGLRRCAEIVRGVAKERHLACIELHEPLTEILKNGTVDRLCGNDRVHPGAPGHALIAAHILKACQGEADDLGELARSLREAPHASCAIDWAQSCSEYRRLAEYKKVIRSMGGDGADAKVSDALLDRWVETGRGTDWYEAAQAAAKAYRTIRDREETLKEREHDAFGRLRDSICPKDVSRFVDPFIGCADNGHCFAAAACPFGMVQAGPDTGYEWWDYCSGYRHADTNILGFSQTHLSGTGCGDLGDVLVMPFAESEWNAVRSNWNRLYPRASAYRRESQVAKPGYYAVELKDNRVKVEIAAAPHAAIYRFAYRGDGTPRLYFDLQHGMLNWNGAKPNDRSARVLSFEFKRVSPRRMVGRMRTKVWVEREFGFALEFDHDVGEPEILPKSDPKDVASRGLLTFAARPGATVVMKFAISRTSPDAAVRNLEAEIPDWDFERVRASASKRWNDLLSRATIGGSAAQKAMWYTSLYHLFLQPNDIADVGEKPIYSTFSCWDTFRAAHPLYTLLVPERVPEMIGSLLAEGQRNGFLPIWSLWGKDNQCMIGSHAVPIIVDWFLKSGGHGVTAGVAGGARRTDCIDWESAYRQIKDTLTIPHPSRQMEQWDILDRHGYYPFDKVNGESVSRTLECAYDDACAARMAAVLGKGADADFFTRRSHAWTNLFDRTSGWMRGKDSMGRWRTPFDPRRLGVGAEGGRNDYTEGNACQYSWHVMQHPRELISRHGGNESFVQHLDEFFADHKGVSGEALDATGLIGQYAHGNEPSHHTAYFFTLAGRPDRTADTVRQICDRFYHPEPEGLCGNDDCGQMSAWYLFSAMGFYPFDPCGGEYVIGAPQVEKATLHCSPSTFTIIAKDLSKENKYVKSITLNGRPIRDWKIRHEDIVKGGELVFEMWNGKLRRKGYWREEAGILKYVVGRDVATSEAEAKAAYDRPVGGRIWRIVPSMTLDEVNELEVHPGDKVLFERGGVWRGQLHPRSGKPGYPIIYGACGEGAKPSIQPSYARNDASMWRQIEVGGRGQGVWTTETSAAADIGNVIFDEGKKGCAFKRGTFAELKDDLDFWCDPKTFAVHLKSAVNPAERFKSIEICEKVHCIEEAKMHDVVYDGLALRYTAAHGIGGDGVKRITVRNCEISWIGGGYLYYDKKGNGVRYGNGIEFWSNCEDVLVESNRVWECWDAGLTNQSNEDGAVQKNVVWRGNEVWNCEYSYEYWQQGDRAMTENVVVEGNRFWDAGKGWGHRQRWNPNAAHLMFYDTTAGTKGFVVRDNVFSRSENTLVRLFNDWRKNVTFEGNRWIAEKESLCRFHGRPTAKLVYRYPDRLDQMHDDNLAEIESQTVTPPRVFGADQMRSFKEFINE